MAGKTQTAPRRTFRSRKQQTRLEFSPLPSSSPAKDKYNQAVQSRLANIRYDGAASPARVASPDREMVDRAVTSLPTPQPSSQPAKAMSADPSSSLSEPPPSSPSLPSAEPNPETDNDDEDELILPSSKRRRIGTRSTPLRRSGRLQNSSPTGELGASSSRSAESFVGVEIPSPSKGRDLSNLGSPETSGDEAEILLSRPTQRSRRALGKETYYTEPVRSRQSRRDDFVADDDDVEYITSDEEVAPPKSRRRKSSRQEHRPKTPRRMTRDEQDELEADLEDLRDSENESSAQKRRTRGGPVTTKRDRAKEHFDLLKRRRAGEQVPRIHDSADDEDAEDINLIGKPLQDLSDERSVQSSIDTDLEPDEQFDAEDEDTFIEEDSAGRRGRPHPDIPLEFTHFASAKPSELFIHVIEWLVKNKLSPAFARGDDLYRLAMNRVDDQVKAQAGSRLISSAWNATFKFTILARPEILIDAFSGDDERACDACNKSNRPARYEFVLSGDAYSKNTLEPVNDSDDEEDEYDDGASRDEAGHVLAKREQHFYLGSHCAANAQMGHKLTHWKFHLNEAVLQYLEEQGVLSAEAIVARDKLNNKKREKEAEAVVDSMEATGKIAGLWRDFKNDLDDARMGMEDFQKKGARSQGRIGVIRSSGADGILREWNNDKYKQKTIVLSDSE